MVVRERQFVGGGFPQLNLSCSNGISQELASVVELHRRAVNTGEVHFGKALQQNMELRADAAAHLQHRGAAGEVDMALDIGREHPPLADQTCLLDRIEGMDIALSRRRYSRHVPLKAAQTGNL